MAGNSKGQMVCCMQCKNGVFMQWMENPVICECTRRKNERFVAEMKRICPLYEKNSSTPTIVHYDRYTDVDE